VSNNELERNEGLKFEYPSKTQYYVNFLHVTSCNYIDNTILHVAH